jgi:hypothetical protein
MTEDLSEAEVESSRRRLHRNHALAAGERPIGSSQLGFAGRHHSWFERSFE